jgi:hypothetical protein
LAAGKVGDGALAAAGIPGSTGQNVQYIYKYNIDTRLNSESNMCFIHKKDEMYLYICSCSRESEK